MAERKVYTEEQKAAIKARRDERNAATKTLLSLIIAVGVEGAVTEEMVELAKLAQPKTSAGIGGSRKASQMSLVLGMFENTNEVDEIAIFQELHMGRGEMATATKNIIKKSKPEDRVWIHFDADNGMYIVEGRGAEVPEGWTGYVPVEEIVDPDFSEEDDDPDLA